MEVIGLLIKRLCGPRIEAPYRGSMTSSCVHAKLQKHYSVKLNVL